MTRRVSPASSGLQLSADRRERDRDHALVKTAGATITPEAAVFDARQRLVYRGRIDDRFVELGRERPAATQHDLRNALTAALAGKPVSPSHTQAVGCFIADMKSVLGTTKHLHQSSMEVPSRRTLGSIWWIEVVARDPPIARDFYGQLFGWNARDTSFEPFAVYTVFERPGNQEAGCSASVGMGDRALLEHHRFGR